MSTLKEATEERAQFRAECRKLADAIVHEVIERVERAPREYQTQVLNMVETELRHALKVAGREE